ALIPQGRELSQLVPNAHGPGHVVRNSFDGLGKGRQTAQLDVLYHRADREFLTSRNWFHQGRREIRLGLEDARRGNVRHLEKLARHESLWLLDPSHGDLVAL